MGQNTQPTSFCPIFTFEADLLFLVGNAKADDEKKEEDEEGKADDEKKEDDEEGKANCNNRSHGHWI